MEHSDLCVGIDLGTTNSVIATCNVDGSRIETPVSRIERYVDMNARGNVRRESRELLPSCVYYADEGDGTFNPIVGDFAKEVSLTQPFAVARSIKRQMGQSEVNIPGWNKDYPDQTPEAVSSRILSHLKESIEDYYGETITDAVITIPASFDLAQREATLRAAELAGFAAREEDGSYRDDILISEPEAVIYDVLNQVQNGRINLRMDFTEKKRVLVFDIGGGTLDITLHEISKVPDSGHFEIRPLATNRFSTVAGDMFDQALAEWMEAQYLEEYEQQIPEIAKKWDKAQNMVRFREYAEELKIKVSNVYRDRTRRGNKMPEYIAYGGQMPNGYNSENEMAVEDFEDVLRPLLGDEFKFEDYRNFDKIKDDKNIIYPILDVLQKASRKVEEKDLKVDAIILNGGMSRLYLIENRLQDFFGIPPITINDPDKSVAQGASVYHYYLHQDDQARELHRIFQEQLERGIEADAAERERLKKLEPSIQTISGVLSDDVYLGLRGGGTHKLVESGQDLPYTSELVTGFSVGPRQTCLRFPIKQKLADGTYRTIASGDLYLKRPFTVETPITLQFLLGRSGTLTIQAWVGTDDSKEPLRVTLNLNTQDLDVRAGRGGRVLPRAGSILIPVNEVSGFRDLVNNLRKLRGRSGKRSGILNALKERKRTITMCGNPEAFAGPALKMLRDADTQLNMNFLPVARKLATFWTEDERKELSKHCVRVLHNELQAPGWAQQLEVSENGEAIRTIGLCGIPEDIEKLTPLMKSDKYKTPLLYAFARSGLHTDWVCTQLQQEVRGNTICTSLQDSIYAVGLAFRREDHQADQQMVKETADALETLIRRGRLKRHELVLAVVALGEICANGPDREGKIGARLEALLTDLPDIYPEDVMEYSNKARSVALLLIQGPVSEDDEMYLLGLFAND